MIRSLFKFSTRLARCTSGSALVEMTIMAPILISLFAGAVDYGMFLSTQATLDKSVRDAARYLGSLPKNLDGSRCPAPSWAVTNAQNLVTTGATNFAIDCTTYPGTVVVSANLAYNSIILARFLPIASTFTLSTQHQERQVGEY
jgi:Flp pilus assembly protein TadG